MFIGTPEELRLAKRKVAALFEDFAAQLNHLDDIHPGLGDATFGEIVTGVGTLRRRGSRWTVQD